MEQHLQEERERKGGRESGTKGGREGGTKKGGGGGGHFISPTHS